MFTVFIEYSTLVWAEYSICNALLGTKEYDELCADPSIKHPEKHVENQAAFRSVSGLFQCQPLGQEEKDGSMGFVR